MTDDTSGKKGWLELLAEGGLPQMLAGPAGKAISRLVGAGIEIPAAHLEARVQNTKDQSAARSLVSNSIAEKVAQLAIEDGAVMERALNNMLAKQYRAQQNKDAIAKSALENLETIPPPSNSDGPSDDWMTRFERYAEDAESEDLRELFGRLLSGEIRQRGSVSPSTLHFVSMLDRETAKLIERVLPYTTLTGVAFLTCIEPQLTDAEKTFVEQSGFWTLGKQWSVDSAVSTRRIALKVAGSKALLIQGKEGQRIHLQVALLSRAGRDLISVVAGEFNFQSVANAFLATGGVEHCYYAVLAGGEDKTSSTGFTELVELFQTDTI